MFWGKTWCFPNPNQTVFNPSALKGKFHPKMKIQSVLSRPRDDRWKSHVKFLCPQNISKTFKKHKRAPRSLSGLNQVSGSPTMPRGSEKTLFYNLLWAESFTVAAQLKALAWTPTVRISGPSDLGIWQGYAGWGVAILGFYFLTLLVFILLLLIFFKTIFLI